MASPSNGSVGPWHALMDRQRAERIALVVDTLNATHGNRYKTAQRLGMHRNHLYKVMETIDAALIPASQHGGNRRPA